MTALVSVSSYLPDERVPIEDLAEQFGLTSMQIRVFRKYHKLGEVHVDRGGTLIDLLRGAVTGLHALRGREHHVKYVLFARTFPVVVPYPLNPLHELCREVGLGHAEAFTVTHHACASGLLAIDIAGRLLAADDDPHALALILAGEKTFTPEAHLVPETSIFGEGASAALVSADGHRDRLIAYTASLRGEFDGELAEVAGQFQREYPDSLAEAILAAVDTAGARMDEISLILPHNVNSVAWQRVCRRLEFPMSRVLLDHVATHGHVFCADAFINYEAALARDLLRPGDRYVMAAAGAGRGATFSAMVFEH
jgi:3-oxoacyl-[acyl-carrier-protein] synthase-3